MSRRSFWVFRTQVRIGVAHGCHDSSLHFLHPLPCSIEIQQPQTLNPSIEQRPCPAVLAPKPKTPNHKQKCQTVHPKPLIRLFCGCGSMPALVSRLCVLSVTKFLVDGFGAPEATSSLRSLLGLLIRQHVLTRLFLCSC